MLRHLNRSLKRETQRLKHLEQDTNLKIFNKSKRRCIMADNFKRIYMLCLKIMQSKNSQIH